MEQSWLLSSYDMFGVHLKLLYCWTLFYLHNALLELHNSFIMCKLQFTSQEESLDFCHVAQFRLKYNSYIAIFRTTLNSDKPKSLYTSVSKNVYVLSNTCKWFSTHFSKWLLLIFLLHTNTMLLLIKKVDRWSQCILYTIVWSSAWLLRRSSRIDKLQPCIH
jgi:hypothetical protein